MDYEYKLFEFNIYNKHPTENDLSDEDIEPIFNVIDSDNDDSCFNSNEKTDPKIFIIQMFGINEKGEQASIIIEDFEPFFYAKMPDDVNDPIKFVKLFKKHIIGLQSIGKYYKNSIKFEIVSNKKLYGFDNNKKYNFIKLTFNNTIIYDKVKKLWYTSSLNEEGENEKKLNKDGYIFNGCKLELYETSIPPLLRFFHIQEISPSGWIKLPKKKYAEIIGENKTTNCHKEFIINKHNVIPLINKETPVPYNVMSFDIEASSSHGDFPVPIKTYKKLATNIIDYFEKKMLNDYENSSQKYLYVKNELKDIIQTAFEFTDKLKNNIDIVYPKTPFLNIDDLNEKIEKLFEYKIKDTKKNENFEQSIEMYFIKNNINNIKKTNVKNITNNDTFNNNNGNNNNHNGFSNNINENNQKKHDDNNEMSHDEVNSDDDNSEYGNIDNDSDLDDDDINIENNDSDNDRKNDEINFNYGNIEEQIEVITENNNSNFNLNEINLNINYTIIDVLCDRTINRETKLNQIVNLFGNKTLFPQLEGDKITFIGSTFKKYGDNEPYLNHCFVLNSCKNLNNIIPNCVIETFDNERDMLLAWTNLVANRENPDIIIGYNIFGFDYEFMFRRAQELGCVEEFLKLSKNKNEICGNADYKTGKYDIDRSLIVLASGAYDLSIIKMNGRLQIDMLNWFRRTENLTSYKLDYVSGYYIGDTVNKCELMSDENEILTMNENKECEIVNELILTTKVYTNNMYGLQIGSYIHFEVINHSSDYYKKGTKFIVTEINRNEKWFRIEGHENPQAKKVKWGLAKDDVSVQDIFRMTNEGPESRSFIAKYCLQDCNLVHYLFNKVDVITDLIEMSKICSVPMSFLVYRGQGIKLTSFVAKKCREKGTLMPTINKGSLDDGYEGAIVLVPKCGLYLDNPIDVGDFASLYPSSMLSENLSPDSKVWSKIFNLNGELIYESGEKNALGNYIYDNLPGREYVDVTFDTYRYVRKTPGAKKAEKIKSGYKICRFIQPIINKENGKEERAIMPSILEELLKARKDTRKLQKNMNDEFMYNILEKRQLAFKATANSLYGQLGAKTSTFYEPDIAASTTATGRLLLTYAKRVIEECYADLDVDTKHGMVNTKAEYIYGDSVANYTPIYVKINDIVNIITIEDLAMKYGENNWVLCQEKGKENKEFCELSHIDIETWSDKGWTKLHRVIRHQLVPHKQMMRVLTHTGLVDVTDDHSLLRIDGSEVSPKDVNVGEKLLHRKLFEKSVNNVEYDDYENKKLFTGHFSNDEIIEASLYANYLNSINVKFSLNSDEDLSIIIRPYSLQNINDSSIKKIYNINYEGYVYDLTTENHHFAAGVGNLIVHNTDSVFFTFNLSDKQTGEKILGEKALEIAIEIAQEACHNVSKFLKQPHDFEYEKTFMPFCLLSKKRYVGIKYETDPKKGKRNEMGIVLKRRDNAPIVKDVYGGVIDILMKERSLQSALLFVDNCIKQLIDGLIPIDKLIITKSLRSFYKNPQGIAHKVLADRIGEREPGNKPSAGDRISYAYFVNNKKPKNGKKILQGDKIETPEFIKNNNLQLDYGHYITNQIMKPLAQLFGLVLEELWMSQTPPKIYRVEKLNNTIKNIKNDIFVTDQKKIEKKIAKIRDEDVEELIFKKHLIELEHKKNKTQKITNFFKIVKK